MCEFEGKNIKKYPVNLSILTFIILELLVLNWILQFMKMITTTITKMTSVRNRNKNLMRRRRQKTLNSRKKQKFIITFLILNNFVCFYLPEPNEKQGKAPPPFLLLSFTQRITVIKRGENFLEKIFIPWEKHLLLTQRRREELMKLLRKMRVLRIAILCSMLVTCLNEICATGGHLTTASSL